MTIGRNGRNISAAEAAASQTEYTLVTEANVAKLGQPVHLRSGCNPERYIHPVPLKPVGVTYEAGRLLLRVIGYADDARISSFATTVDADSLAGIRVEPVQGVGLVMGIYYDKQLTGVEDRERLFRPEHFYHGVHSGHMGKPEAGIASENPGFYVAGEQFTDDGVSQGPRTFPLGRICGLMGDPLDPAFRAKLGLY